MLLCTQSRGMWLTSEVTVPPGLIAGFLNGVNLVDQLVHRVDHLLKSLRFISQGKESLLEFERQRKRPSQTEGKVAVGVGQVDRHLGCLVQPSHDFPEESDGVFSLCLSRRV